MAFEGFRRRKFPELGSIGGFCRVSRRTNWDRIFCPFRLGIRKAYPLQNSRRALFLLYIRSLLKPTLRYSHYGRALLEAKNMSPLWAPPLHLEETSPTTLPLETCTVLHRGQCPRCAVLTSSSIVPGASTYEEKVF